jgi:tyrosyl-tRNA synthetase
MALADVAFGHLPKDRMHELGGTVADLVVLAEFAKSKSEARRMITNGAIRINDVKITDPHARAYYDEANNLWYVAETMIDE